MTAADSYRAKAAEITARADRQPHSALRAELIALAESYLRLAVQAERNSWTDIVYETPRQSQPSDQGQQQQAAAANPAGTKVKVRGLSLRKVAPTPRQTFQTHAKPRSTDPRGFALSRPPQLAASSLLPARRFARRKNN